MPDQPVILDAKWKELTSKETLDVEQSDICRILAYAQAYNAKRLLLLYPWHEELEKEGILRRWRVTGSPRQLDTAAINVGRPDSVVSTLRRMAERGAW